MAVALGILLSTPQALQADGSRRLVLPTAEAPAYPTSPYHGALDGNGRVIPCRCRFQDREFRLGDVVCMSTPNGNVMTRCDLMQNNTSWVPTDTACTISRGPSLAPGMVASNFNSRF